VVDAGNVDVVSPAASVVGLAGIVAAVVGAVAAVVGAGAAVVGAGAAVVGAGAADVGSGAAVGGVGSGGVVAITRPDAVHAAVVTRATPTSQDRRLRCRRSLVPPPIRFEPFWVIASPVTVALGGQPGQTLVVPAGDVRQRPLAHDHG
jgi:hypothetical protein